MVKTETANIIYQKHAFLWVAVVTGIILLIPLLAMQFTSEVNWDILDFTVMGFLLFSTGSLFILISRRIQNKYHLTLGLLLTVIFLYVWAELAVGIVF